MIAERYERQQAIVLTSNKAFAEWAQVFAGDAVMASAALDRLLHRATVLNIRGDSYRLKDRQRAGGSGRHADLAPATPDQPPGTPGQTKRSRRRPNAAEEEVST